MAGALERFNVVDIAGTVATAYCGKLFADHGADVVNVEPPRGHAIRSLPPFKEGAPRVEASALAAYLSVNKRSVVADLKTSEGRAALASLASAADIVIGDAGSLSELEAIAEREPQTVCIAISWFGLTGPYAAHAGSDGVVHALAGIARGIGEVEGPPLLPSGHQAQIIGGLTAYIVALGACYGRSDQATSVARAGGVIDVSILEANLCFTETGAVGAYHMPSALPARLGVNRYAPTFPMGIYPCKDGWIGITVLTPAQWGAFVELIGEPELGREAKYFSTLARLADAAQIEARMKPRLLERTAREWFDAGQAARVPLAIVPTMAELPHVDQYALRRAFVAITHPDIGTIAAPNTPFRLFATPPKAGGAAPRLGSTARDALASVSARRRETPRSDDADTGADPRAPLSGLRVVDLSMGWAGPLAARHLADLGAEVIKVEACQRFDWWRGWDATPEMLAERSYEKSGAFNMVNRNKLGITLDLQRAEGKALLKRLVALADVVIENYSGDVLAKLALDYAALSAVRPDLVMVSMPAFGTDGPWRSFRAYGSTVEQISGLPHLNGHADWPPTMQHVAYGDAVGGINGAAAALTALAHRQATGRGQYVDLSQAECLFPLAAHGIVAQSLFGKPFARRGSRREEICPSGIFRCLGDDAWVAIQLTDERTWADFAELIGAPELRGLSLAERRACEDEIEGRIEMWTTERRPVGAMAALQAIGVAAGSCYAMGDLLLDPQLQARGFWQVLERAVVGPSPNPAPPYRFSADPLTVRWPAPTLGEHNARVLGDLLGLSDEEIAALRKSGVIGQRPLLD